MPEREMNFPRWYIEREDDGSFVAKFVVPRSRFGAVLVRLDRAGTKALGAALLASATTEEDRLVAVLANKAMNDD